MKGIARILVGRGVLNEWPTNQEALISLATEAAEAAGGVLVDAEPVFSPADSPYGDIFCLDFPMVRK